MIALRPVPFVIRTMIIVAHVGITIITTMIMVTITITIITIAITLALEASGTALLVTSRRSRKVVIASPSLGTANLKFGRLLFISPVLTVIVRRTFLTSEYQTAGICPIQR